MNLYIKDSYGKNRSASEVTCTGCEKTFLKLNKEINKHPSHFCSRECRQKHVNLITNIEKFCAWCNQTITRSKSKFSRSKSGLHFCSRICKDKAQSIDGLPNIKPSFYGQAIKRTYHCCICNVKTTGSKYCTIHRKNLQYENYIAKWQQGEISGNTKSGGISNHIRRFLHEKYRAQCSQCGWSKKHPITKKIPLQVNHINGDSTDSKEINLELICPNCHALTPTYGILNKGNGRKSRLR
jgi:hypothetical protein